MKSSQNNQIKAITFKDIFYTKETLSFTGFGKSKSVAKNKTTSSSLYFELSKFDEKDEDFDFYKYLSKIPHAKKSEKPITEAKKYENKDKELNSKELQNRFNEIKKSISVEVLTYKVRKELYKHVESERTTLINGY